MGRPTEQSPKDPGASGRDAVRTVRMPKELDLEMRVFMEQTDLTISDALRTLVADGLRVRGIDLFSEKRATEKVA